MVSSSRPSKSGQMHAIEHGLCRTLFDFVAMQYIGKQLYPDAFLATLIRRPRSATTTRSTCCWPIPARGCSRCGRERWGAIGATWARRPLVRPAGRGTLRRGLPGAGGATRACCWPCWRWRWSGLVADIATGPAFLRPGWRARRPSPASRWTRPSRPSSDDPPAGGLDRAGGAARPVRARSCRPSCTTRWRRAVAGHLGRRRLRRLRSPSCWAGPCRSPRPMRSPAMRVLFAAACAAVYWIGGGARQCRGPGAGRHRLPVSCSRF